MAVTNEQMIYTIEFKNNGMNENLSETTNIAKQLDAIMKILNDTVKANSKTNQQHEKTLQKTVDTIHQNNENLKKNIQHTDNLTKSVAQSTSVFEKLFFAISSVTITFRKLYKAYQIMSDPRVLKALQDILVILQVMAIYKGFDLLARSIEIARKKLEMLAEALTRVRALMSGEIFTRISEAADKSRMFLFITKGISALIKEITALLAVMATVIAGFSIFKTISKEGLDFRKIISGIGKTFSDLFNSWSKGFSKVTTSITTTRITVDDLMDALTALGVGGAIVTATNLSEGFNNTSIAGLKAIGISLALGLALKGVLFFVGSFIEAIGRGIVDAMSRFQEKFALAQQALMQFGFIVRNFGKAYGTEFIGSLSNWEMQITRLANSTSNSTNTLLKSTKLIIAENQSLGMSYEENVKFLDRSVEIAANSQLDLLDVVQRLQSALVGNATAVASLGINLGAHAIEHSDLNKTIQKTIGTMTEQEKLQIALYEIYKQTEPLVGSAIIQGKTIIGINQQLANSYERIQEKLGAVNSFSLALSSTYLDLIRNISNLPMIFFDIIGTISDVSGVTLRATGFILKWILAITFLTSVYKTLNLIIMTNTALQLKLNAIAKILGITFQFQAGQVTTAAAALSIMGKVLKGTLIFSLHSLKSAVIGASIAIGQMAMTILTSVKFLKGAGWVAIILLVIKALDELNEEFKIIDRTMESFHKSFADFKDLFTGLGQIIASGLDAAIQTIKILIVSVAALYNGLKLAAISLRKLFRPAEDAPKYDKMIDDTLHSLDMLAASHSKSMKGIASAFKGLTGSSTAYAQSLERNADLIDELAFRQIQLNRASEEIDFNTIRIEVLGSEVEKLINQYSLASNSVKNLSSEILKSSDLGTEAIKEYKQALEDQANASAQLDKFKIETMKNITNMTREAQKESLRLSGDETAQVNNEFKERTLAVLEFENQLSRLGPIAKESAASIAGAYAAIEMSRINAVKEILDKENEEYTQLLKDQSEIMDDISKKNRALEVSILGDGITARQKINETLKIDTAELQKQIDHYTAAWGANSKIVQALEQQRLLLIENSKVQHDMADMELPDWIDDLKESIDKAFGKENVDSFFSAIEEGIEAIKRNPIVVSVQNALTPAPGGTTDGGTNDGFTSAPEGTNDGFISKAAEIISKGASILKSAVSVIASTIGKVGGWIGQAIQMVFEADKIIRAMIDIPKQLLKIILELPKLLQELIDKFPEMMRKLAEALPGVLIKLVDMIPDFVASMLEYLPLMIERLAEAWPEIFFKLVAMLPDLIVMLVRAVLLAIQGLVKGLIRGISNVLKGIKMPKVQIDSKGIENIGKKLAGSTSRLFKVTDLTDSAKDPINKMTEMITEAFRKGRDWIKEAWNWVDEKIIQPLFAGLKAVWMFVWDKIIQPLFAGLKAVWMFVWDKIIQPLFAGLKAVWEDAKKIFAVIIKAYAAVWEGAKKIFAVIIQAFAGVWEVAKKIFQAIIQAYAAVWEVAKKIFAVIIQAFAGVWEGVKAVFSWVFDMFGSIWDGLGSAVSNAFSFLKDVGSSIAQPITEAFAGIMSIFNSIGDALKSLFKLDFSGLKEAMAEVFSKGGEIVKNAFKGVVNPIINMFNGLIGLLNKLIIPGVEWSVSAGRLGSWKGKLFNDIDLIPGTIGKLQTLAKGGIVETAGFGTDTVPAMLTPGEFIMSRSAVNSIGIGNLRAMNSSGSAGGSNTYNISFAINVDAKTTMDEGYIRGTLIPRMSDELKRASLDGKFVLSQKGIR